MGKYLALSMWVKHIVQRIAHQVPGEDEQTYHDNGWQDQVRSIAEDGHILPLANHASQTRYRGLNADSKPTQYNLSTRNRPHAHRHHHNYRRQRIGQKVMKHYPRG